MLQKEQLQASRGADALLTDASRRIELNSTHLAREMNVIDGPPTKPPLSVESKEYS